MSSTQDSPTQHLRDQESQSTPGESSPSAEPPESQTTVEDDENWGNNGHESDYSDDDASETEERFPYSVEEFVAIFTEFYQFLAKLHYDPANLKFPPPGGWPQLPPEHVGTWKEDFALDVIRHLPYFAWGSPATQLDYKSHLVDYSYGPRFFDGVDWRDEDMDDEEPFNTGMCFVIAEGHESGGQQWVLDVEHGVITVDSLRCDTNGPFDLREFFEGIMDKYRKLELISSPGRVTLDGSRVAERAERIKEEEVMAEKRWFRDADVDLQFLKQVYRDHGWPDSFRREECREYIDDFMMKLEKTRGESWEADYKM